MAAIARDSSRFAGVKAFSEKFSQPEVDADGRIRKIETREDEEQNVKMAETIELLLAAGYFRARIKGLSPFDKVVGGMTWCISVCDFDVDVDLLFQENSTIGQKIALTEKIVAVLPRMKCPHRLEPHQIQGLDFINIFPVVQWLVKRAIERKEEMGDYIREFSVSQFNKHHSTPKDDEFSTRKPKCIFGMENLKETYKPRRRYRKPESITKTDEETRVRTTLLEYGWQYGFSKEQRDKEKEQAEKKKAAGAAIPGRAESAGEEDEYVVEQKRLKSLLKGMSVMEGKEGALSSSTVGSIVGLQSEEISQIASEYAERQAELQENLGARGERTGGEQTHKRMVASLEKQISVQEKKLEQVQEKHDKLKESLTKAEEQLSQVASRGERIGEEMDKLNEIDNGENASVLQKLRSIVAMNENLKRQEQEFRAHCKEEMARLQDNIEKLKAQGSEDDGEEKERAELISKQYDADKAKLEKIRLLLVVFENLVLPFTAAFNESTVKGTLSIQPCWCPIEIWFKSLGGEQAFFAGQAKQREDLGGILSLPFATRARKNREISSLQRKIDEVPSRAELTQYQRRFLELYNHVAGTHKETKQFFTLYNTLDDTKLYLGKEVSLLNSIHDNFEQAMSSASNKEQFLNQFESIVKGIVDNKDRVEKRKLVEKQKRDALNQQYLEVVEQERLYYKTVKDFTEECHKNEVLLSKLKNLGLS
ncbi:Coiled-coil domain-containing protein 93 [Acropora cervicornis]|uniref:Coiled-coil domain-containing protein 93 n=1 Tax=Acropora cervicornis TaxID=6130 RepID=A0AAD9V858_ACRCE|nr:Coiled-coil domain-containing protein 93 [Acropora cervicornis]